jgi:hypothetical protein
MNYHLQNIFSSETTHSPSLQQDFVPETPQSQQLEYSHGEPFSFHAQQQPHLGSNTMRSQLHHHAITPASFIMSTAYTHQMPSAEQRAAATAAQSQAISVQQNVQGYQAQQPRQLQSASVPRFSPAFNNPVAAHSPFVSQQQSQGSRQELPSPYTTPPQAVPSPFGQRTVSHAMRTQAPSPAAAFGPRAGAPDQTPTNAQQIPCTAPVDNNNAAPVDIPTPPSSIGRSPSQGHSPPQDPTFNVQQFMKYLQRQRENGVPGMAETLDRLYAAGSIAEFKARIQQVFDDMSRKTYTPVVSRVRAQERARGNQMLQQAQWNDHAQQARLAQHQKEMQAHKEREDQARRAHQARQAQRTRLVAQQKEAQARAEKELQARKDQQALRAQQAQQAQQARLAQQAQQQKDAQARAQQEQARLRQQHKEAEERRIKNREQLARAAEVERRRQQQAILVEENRRLQFEEDQKRLKEEADELLIAKAQRLERERKSLRKEQLRKDPSALYRHYNEYLRYFPLEYDQRRSQYHNNLLANRTMTAEANTDLDLAIQFAKDHWQWYLVFPKDADRATSWQKEKLAKSVTS